MHRVSARGLWPLVAALAIFAVLGSMSIAAMLPRGVRNYDSKHYEAMTKQWLSTGVYGYFAIEQPGVADAVVPPGFATFLAPFYALSGHTDPAVPGGPYLAIYGAQLLVGLGFLVLTWMFAETIAGTRAAGIAVLLLAPMWSLYAQPTFLLTQLLATTLFMGYLVVLAAALKRHSAAWAIGAGFMLAATLLTRPTTLPAALVPLVIGLSATLRRDWKVSSLTLGAVAIGMAPWLVRNWIVLGSPSPITGRDETIIAGVDPYFRALGPDFQVSGPTAHAYAQLSDAAKAGVSKLDFTIATLRRDLMRDPLNVIGWFTVGKVQYVGFANTPAANNSLAVDGILRSAIGVLGLTGAIFSVWARNLAPVAIMILAWLALNATIVPDMRYWLDIYPLLATLSGALLATVYEAVRAVPAAGAA